MQTRGSKKITAILVAICFITIAVFGFAGMNNKDARGHSVCIAVTAHGGSCGPEPNILMMASFYLSTFLSFSTAVFTDIILAAVFILILFITSQPIKKIFPNQSGLVSITVTKHLAAEDSVLLQQYHHWLALLEHSPAV